jgi:hypothetical protein
MTDLKKFLATQTAVAQALLEELLRVHPDEERDDVVPPVTKLILGHKRLGEKSNYNYFKLKKKKKKEKAILTTL